MLKTLLTPDVVQVIPQVKDWREAIKIACQPLIDKGCIEPRYVDAIYKCIRTRYCYASCTS